MHAGDGSAELDDPRAGDDEVSRHVIRAREGDQESLTWLIVHFSPLLWAQAAYRLRGPLQHLCDPDDLVDEVWAVTLPRLGDLRGEPHRLGRVLLGFLTTALLYKVRSLIERQRRRPGSAHVRSGSESSDLSPLDRVAGKTGPASGVLQGLEAQGALYEALASLSDEEREVIVLRGLEQRPNDEVAQLLDLTPGGATRRYQRALERLRRRLPGSVFDWLRRE